MAKKKKKKNKVAAKPQPYTRIEPATIIKEIMKEPVRSKSPGLINGTLQFTQVEFDAGHDGLLRGQPEAAFLVGLYFIYERDITLLAKHLLRVHPQGRFPSTESLADRGIVAGALPKQEGHLLVLVIALEEDSSSEVDKLYKRLSEPDGFQVWPKEEEVPSPDFLRDAPQWAAKLERSRAVHLMYNRRDIRDECKRDDFVGAHISSVLLPLEREQELRMRFVTPEKNNDWTLSTQLRVVG